MERMASARALTSLGGGRKPAGRRRGREGSLSFGDSRGRPRRLVGQGGRPRSDADGRPLHLRGGGRVDGPRRRCRRPPDHWTARVSSQASGQPFRSSSLHPWNRCPTLRIIGRWAELPRQTEERRLGDRLTQPGLLALSRADSVKPRPRITAPGEEGRRQPSPLEAHRRRG